MTVEREWQNGGRTLIEVIREDDGSFVARWEKELDAEGRAVKETCINVHGEIMEWWEKEYGSAGNGSVRETRFHPDGTVAERREKRYDENGQLISETAISFDEE